MTKTTWWILVVAAAVTSPSAAWAGDAVVALQTADPSCADDSGNTYVNCGNGTVTDNRTGLVWLRNADCYGGHLTWHQAVEIVANLSDVPATSAAAGDDCGLSDGSSAGEWRLPSISEWTAMVADGQDLDCDPVITNDQGDGCWGTPLECFVQDRNCSFQEAQSESYWSSTSNQFLPSTSAWRAHLAFGFISATFKDESYHFWPVRGGQ